LKVFLRGHRIGRCLAPDREVTYPTVEFQWLKTSCWGTRQGGGDHPVEPLDFPALWIKEAVHRRTHGGAPLCFRCSRVKGDGGTALPMVVTRQWTAVHLVVYIGHISERPPTRCSQPPLGGHHPRGGGATNQGGDANPTPPSHPSLASHHPRGGSAPRGSTSSTSSPPLLHLQIVPTPQVFHHHMQVC